jgi:aspartate 1-decarboxylase
MKRILLKSKIHRACVTQADLDYEGSISIDRRLLAAADIVEHEQVQVYDITNGHRLTTYAIAAEAGSGTIGINGAAARLVNTGDLVIIASYAQYENAEAQGHRPRIVLVDQQNRPRQAADHQLRPLST